MSVRRDLSQAALKPGDRMRDGTVYAGISPDTGKKMYTTPKDAHTRTFFGNYKLTFSFSQAQRYAAKLDIHGHNDWRVPTIGELNELFKNRAAIGGFDEGGSWDRGRYWSSSPYISDNRIWAQCFSDGFQHGDNRSYISISSLRCVRG